MAKFRMTKARKTIIDIFDTSKLPLTAQEVNAKLKVNKTTVYRELDFLVRDGMLTEVNFSDGKNRFEKTRDHHHHLVCDNCGFIEEVFLDETRLLESIKSDKFEVTRHNLEFFGICQKCTT